MLLCSLFFNPEPTVSFSETIPITMFDYPGGSIWAWCPQGVHRGEAAGPGLEMLTGHAAAAQPGATHRCGFMLECVCYTSMAFVYVRDKESRPCSCDDTTVWYVRSWIVCALLRAACFAVWVVLLLCVLACLVWSAGYVRINLHILVGCTCMPNTYIKVSTCCTHAFWAFLFWWEGILKSSNCKQPVNPRFKAGRLFQSWRKQADLLQLFLTTLHHYYVRFIIMLGLVVHDVVYGGAVACSRSCMCLKGCFGLACLQVLHKTCTQA
jgi:hypothetical protein